MQIWYIVKIFTIFFLYMLWLECCPQLGNIWIRPDHTGKLRFRPMNLLRFILAPIHPVNGYIFWNPELLDINFIIFAIGMWYFLEIIPISAKYWEYVLEPKKENESYLKNK